MTFLGAKVEGRHTANFILTEANGFLSRRTVTLGQSAKLSAGRVLGQVTGSKDYVPHDPSLTNGAQKACAILYDNVNAADGAVEVVVIGEHAEVIIDQLIWKDGITDEQKATGIADLETKQIIAR